jgi:hypothetical protein
LEVLLVCDNLVYILKRKRKNKVYSPGAGETYVLLESADDLDVDVYQMSYPRYTTDRVDTSNVRLSQLIFLSFFCCNS